MRSILLYGIYSGQLFFLLAPMFLALAALDIAAVLDRRPRWRRLSGFVLLLVVPLGVLAAPPLPLLIAVSTPAVSLIYIFLGFGRPARRVLLGMLTAGVMLVAVAVEVPYHVRRPQVTRPPELVVIGDSLSSGGFGDEQPWPELLGRATAIRVQNLSLASADAAMAVQRQLPLLSAPKSSTVFVAVGGNDMLSGNDVRAFERDLEQIVLAAVGEGRRVLMMELPILPGRWRYGAAQRRVARRHGAVLIPKRILVSAIVPPRNTSDGIHLTTSGHEALARNLRDWLRW